MRFKGILLAAAAVLMIGAGSRAVQAASNAESGRYDRSSFVDPQERLQGKDGKPAVTPTPTPDPRAWQKINGVCYNGSGKPIPGAITRGTDVSEWQGYVNWSQVKQSAIDFVILRIGCGTTYADKYFDYNMKSCNALGIPAGAYVYSYATTPQAALEEAKLAIRKVNGYRISYPIVYDMESPKIQVLSKSKKADLAIAFCEEIKKAGYFPMVYTNANWYNNEIDMEKLKDYEIWLAWYGDRLNAPDRTRYRYGIWQCTDGDGGGVLRPTAGLVRGFPVANNIDLDFGFVDYTKRVTPRTAPVSGYKPSATPATVKNGWYTTNGKTYYFNDGKMYYGAKNVGGKTYLFEPNEGYLVKDQLLYFKGSKNAVYGDKNGLLVKNRWVSSAGKWYYMGSNGFALKGFQNVRGKSYLFDKTYCYAYFKYKHKLSNGKLIYYGLDAAMVRSSWVTIKENGVKHTYFFGMDGTCYRGWHTIGGKKYYFFPGTGSNEGIRAEKVTLKISGKYYTFDANGICVSVR